MLPEHRQNRILKLLSSGEGLPTKDIAGKLGISLPTLWRDLNVLSARDKIARLHGGAMLKKKNEFELLFANRLKRNVAQKARIAERAAGMVEPGDIIALDSGTTVLLMAKALKERSSITVVSPSLCVAEELISAKGVYRILLGGDVKEETMAACGPMTLQQIRNLRIDKYFMGAVAFNPSLGTQDAYLFEIEIKKAIMAVSGQIIVLADSGKFGKTSLSVTAGLRDIDILITDRHLAGSHLSALRKSGMKVITV